MSRTVRSGGPDAADPGRQLPGSGPAAHARRDRVVTRLAAIFAWLTGLGFGLPGVYGLWFFAKHGYVWTFMGFPTYGAGPLAQRGIETGVPLLAGFVAVCGAELVVGALLWTGRPTGSWLALAALLPVEFVYWFGFALPLGPICGLARTALVGAALAASPQRN
jgi:hypothetical protein